MLLFLLLLLLVGQVGMPFGICHLIRLAGGSDPFPFPFSCPSNPTEWLTFGHQPLAFFAFVNGLTATFAFCEGEGDWPST